MTNPFTRHVWIGRVNFQHQAELAPEHYFEIDGLIGDPTSLLRTLVWVHFAGYSFYEIGATGLLNTPVGFALGAVNGTAFNGNEPSDDPQNEWVDLIANGSTVLNYTGLGWAPDSTAHLSGSVNEIDSSATLATTENLNTFMYGNKTLFVDSKAQRTFTEAPRFKFVYTEFGSSLTTATSVDVWMHVRMLFQQQ